MYVVLVEVKNYTHIGSMIYIGKNHVQLQVENLDANMKCAHTYTCACCSVIMHTVTAMHVPPHHITLCCYQVCNN